MTEIDKLKTACRDCRACAIGGCDYGAGVANVFSNMNTEASIMVVGQAPGDDEVTHGSPFVGASGKLFEEALREKCGLELSDLYLTNTVKCLVPGGRKPKGSEIDSCGAFLEKEIKLVDPVIIIAFGATAFKSLTGMSGINKHQNTLVYSVKYKVNVLAMMHPNPHNMGNPELRKVFDEGLEMLNEFFRLIKVY